MDKLREWPIWMLGLILLVLSGCAGQRAFQTGQDLLLEEQYDAAVAHFAKAVDKNPDSKEYRVSYLRARTEAARQHLAAGREALHKGDYTSAARGFQQARSLDPSLEAANQELRRVREKLRAEELIEEAEEFFRARKFRQAKQNLEQALEFLPGDPQARKLLDKVRKKGRTVVAGHELELASTEPITLKFKDADLRDVFNILSKLSGINFIFDEDIRSEQVSILLEDATFAQALQLLLKMNDLDMKVLNARTIILYPKTREKAKQYEDQIIQTFYLSNIDAKKAVNLLRTMLQLRKIYVHEEINALVVRDEPEVIQLAGQIIEAADRADAEVVFDLELVEISHGDDLELGPRLSTYSVSAGLGQEGNGSGEDGGTTGSIVSETLGAGDDTGNLVRSFSSLDSFYTLPTATFNFAKTLTDSEVLANPQIRVKDKEKAKVHIGTREPVITVTINGDNRSDNVQYVDVGVKLDIEPNIQLDNNVVTKISLEVSSVSDRQTTTSGTQVLTITTTNAQTALTLKDGEQTIIGGLIRDDLSKSKTSIPLIGDLPLIGNLLSSHTRNKQKREILLSITPHIVRNLELPQTDVASIWSGGEDDLGTGPQFGAFISAEEEAVKGPPAPAPALKERGGGAPSETETEAPEAEEPEAAPREEAPTGEPAPTGAAPQKPASSERSAADVSETPPKPEEQVEMVELEPFEIPEAGRPRVFAGGPELVDAGEVFPVEVRVAEIEDLFSAPLFVGYDAERLEFVRAEEGDFLKREGQTTIFTTSANPAAGRVIVGLKQGAGGAGLSGSGSLFRLFFRARKAGAAELELERLNFRDPEGNRIPVEGEGLTLEVR